MAATGTDPPAGAVTLDDDERELVTLELRTLLPALRDDRQARYERLRAAVDAGVVPGELAGELASLCELTLQTARARQLYRAEGEKILTDLLRRTPRGRELAKQISDVNAALKALEGHAVDSMSVRMRTIGHFTVTVATEAVTLTLAVRPDTINVESVEVGQAE